MPREKQTVRTFPQISGQMAKQRRKTFRITTAANMLLELQQLGKFFGSSAVGESPVWEHPGCSMPLTQRWDSAEGREVAP